MDRLVITGNGPLQGEIQISGAKNSGLKLMAAALLTDQPVTLANMPNLADTRFLSHLLASLGVEVYWPKNETTCHLNAAEMKSTIAPYEQVRKMRASLLCLGTAACSGWDTPPSPCQAVAPSARAQSICI